MSEGRIASNFNMIMMIMCVCLGWEGLGVGVTIYKLSLIYINFSSLGGGRGVVIPL